MISKLSLGMNIKISWKKGRANVTCLVAPSIAYFLIFRAVQE